jgi:FOG: Ankyrin repeat
LKKLTDKELFEAVKKGDAKTASQLLSWGADVNAKNKNGKTPLMVAAEHRHNYEMIRLLIKSGANVNEEDSSSLTALYHSAAIGIETKTLKLLLNAGADAKFAGNGQCHSIISLIDETSNEAALITLLKSGISYTLISSIPWTPLMYAAHLQHKRKAFLLVATMAKKAKDSAWENIDLAELRKAGASSTSLIRHLAMKTQDINETDEMGNTALHIAANIRNSSEAVKTLINLGADIHLKNVKGHTPLARAAMSGYNYETIKLLIDKGAEVDSKDSMERTPLFFALMNKSSDKIISLFLACGADPNAQNIWGQTPLMYVTAAGTAALLLKAGAAPNIQAKPLIGYASVLNCVIEHKADTKTVEQLLKAGADPNSTEPALFHAITNKAPLSVIRMLLTYGANIDQKTDTGETALQNALTLGYYSAAALLITKGAQLGPLCFPEWTSLMHVTRFAGCNDILYSVAKRRKDTDRSWMLLFRMLAVNNPPKSDKLISSLISSGLDVNAVNTNGENTLFCFSGSPFDVSIMERLIKAGIDVNKTNNQGKTALMNTATLSNEALLTRLLNAGASVEARDEDGNTALHYASKGTHIKNLSTLIKHRAELDARNYNEETPLMTAILDNHDSVANALIEAGADTEAKNKDGETALLMAIQAGYDDCVKVLLNSDADILAQNSKGENVVQLIAGSCLKSSTKNRIKEAYQRKMAGL